ncbi:MAG: sporulation integral membrane protein YtvI [Lachnospiraceae bacterium]|nr:sporulation integral membrane protein YtvI [Lachnospiraceae bacterium]
MKDTGLRFARIIVNLSLFIGGVLFFVIVVPRILGFFMPFVIGWIISLMANPLVKFLEKKIKMKRRAGSAMVIIAVIAILVLILYAVISKLVTESIGLINDLPNIYKSFEGDLEQIARNLNLLLAKLPPDIRDAFTNIGTTITSFLGSMIENMGTPTVEAVGSFAKNLPSVLIGIIMGILSAYFFIAEKDEISQFLKKHLPVSVQEKWHIFYSSLKQAVGGYFIAQLKIEIWIYIMLVIGFMVLDIEYGMLIALGIAVFDFFPIFGMGAVMIPWALIKLLSSDYIVAVGFLIMYGAGLLGRQLLQPKIVGDSIGIAPMPTLFLLFLGFKFGGVAGMIFAVPIGIVLVNLNQAGIFDNARTSIRLLIKTVNDFRKYDQKDISYLENGQNEFDQEKEIHESDNKK